MTLVHQQRHARALPTDAPALPSRLLHPWQHRWARRRAQRIRARRQAQAWDSKTS